LSRESQCPGATAGLRSHVEPEKEGLGQFVFVRSCCCFDSEWKRLGRPPERALRMHVFGCLESLPVSARSQVQYGESVVALDHRDGNTHR